MSVNLPFPTSVSLSEAEMAARFWRCDHTLASDPQFHFSIVIPRTWRPVEQPAEVPSEDAYFTTLALFRDTSEGPMGEAEIYASQIDREMTGADWLQIFLDQREMEVLASRRIPAAQAGDRLDVLTRRVVGGETIVSRWFVLKDGGDRRGVILFAEVRTTEANYRRVADDFLVVVGHLALMNPSGWPFAERLRTFTRGRPGDFLIHYPYSWTLSEIRADEDRSGISVAHIDNEVDGAPVGRITFICSGSAQGPQELLSAFTRSLTTRSMIPDLGELVEAPPFGGLERGWMTHGRGHQRVLPDGSPGPLDEVPEDLSSDPNIDPDPKFDIRVFIGKRESTWYLVGLAGVTRSKLPAAGAINDRAFEIVIKMMKTERA